MSFGITIFGGVMMKSMKSMIMLLVLAIAAFAEADVVLPTGLTGFWEFSDSTDVAHATVGTALGLHNVSNADWVLGGLGGALYVQKTPEKSYLEMTHNIGPNGGGSYVNEWSILMDIMVPQSSMGNWVALYQTNPSNTNDGDFFVKNNPAGQIGVAATGYSTNTISGDTWYRVVVSVDNGSFYRIYVNGSQWLEGNVQAIDGRFSLDPTLLIFADEDGEDYPKYCSTLAMWNRTLTGAEIASVGNAYTVIVPEPATIALLCLGGLGIIGRKRR
jgi:hypothetical protein